MSQTRTSSLGAVRPLPQNADIGPGGQSVGSTSPNARRCTRSRASEQQNLELQNRLGREARARL
ncbi:MAG: hypothetical protein WB685_16125, partial [Pseudolabrys sp.]